MHIDTQPKRILSLLIAGLAWLVLASGIGRALVICTEMCGAEHVAFVHAHGACGHGGAHAHSHDHAHAHDHAHGQADEHAGPAADAESCNHEVSDPAGSDACSRGSEGCEDRALPNDAATRLGQRGMPCLPPLACIRPRVTTPDAPFQSRNAAPTVRQSDPGGGRVLLALRI